ncbi:MAG: adenylate/guanylate cyclase domain-containing protein, partial [Spirochaetales bacterium]
ADLVKWFSRISNPLNRERALFLDIFFVEPSEQAQNDVLLVDAFEESDRVFIETALANEFPPPDAEAEFFERHERLFETHGRLPAIGGAWREMQSYFGLEPPLQPYAIASAGYGHANFNKDWDEVFRRQPLVAKVSRLIEILPFSELSPDTAVDVSNYERLAWIDRDGTYHNLPYPLKDSDIIELERTLANRAPRDEIDTDGDGEIDVTEYLIRRFRDRFIPSITLSLALEYFGKTYDDLEIVIGEHIIIRDLEVFNPETGSWEPYVVPVSYPVLDEDDQVVEAGRTRQIDELVIPINGNGEMLINFMGPRSSAARDGYRTFPVRPYSVYTSRGAPSPDPSSWSSTRGAANKIIMVGPFAAGMADDEKPTPVGLMYGVELHANALNTILMDQFLRPLPYWQETLLLVGVVMLTAFLAGRMRNPLWSFLISLAMIVLLFAVSNQAFAARNLLLPFVTPASAIGFTFISVVLYRVLTEGRERRVLTETFSKFVSPEIVKDLVNRPPTLGGVDREITVLFSDIRSFTSMSEGMGSQQLVRYLNEYLTAMTDTILAYNGTLDKYVGDEIMCFWGAPLAQKDHRILAAKCALRQMEVLNEFNARMAELRNSDPEWQFLPPQDIEIGIGVNSGVMTVGMMGSPGRLNYTLMGDHVNLASRLEGTNKVYGTHVIISENTMQGIADQLITRELDDIRVKGKQRPVTIFELVDVKAGLAPTAEELDYEAIERRAVAKR